jgi:hypothetical protein
MNANSLLNFRTSYYDRGGSSSSGGYGRPAGRGGGGGPRARGAAGRPPKYDRNQFLQANFRYGLPPPASGPNHILTCMSTHPSACIFTKCYSCRFLVSDAIDTASYHASPDLMLEWEDVARVELLSDCDMLCPITLCPMLGPHITPCGHVFDARAIMGHLLESGGPELRRAAPCPLCYTPVAARELRPAVVRRVEAPAVGREVRFALVRRHRDSISPEAAASGGGAAAPAGADPADIACSRFSKFTTTADPSAMWAADGAALGRYSAQLAAEGGQEAAIEAPNVTAAMESLAVRARLWAERRERARAERAGLEPADAAAATEQAGRAAARAVEDACAVAAAQAAHRTERQVAAAALEAQFPALAVAPSLPRPQTAWGKAPGSQARPQQRQPHQRPPTPPFSDGGSAGEEEAVPAGSADVAQLPPSPQAAQPEPSSLPGGAQPAAGPSSDGFFYFYQASDGQPLFLSALNQRMLLQHYGSYASCPPTLTAAVLELEEEVVQSDATRRRLRALAHLPISGAFRLCEVDLAPLLPAAALAPFAEELAQRHKRRVQRDRQAAQRVRREDAAAAAAAAAVVVGPSAADLRAMPRLGDPGGAVPASGGEQAEEGDAGPPREEDIDAPSFARIARLGFAATGPVVGGASGSSPVAPAGAAFPALGAATVAAPAGVWGARGVAAAAPSQPAPSTAAAPRPAEASASIGRGKSGKQTLLFSTAQRRY